MSAEPCDDQWARVLARMHANLPSFHVGTPSMINKLNMACAECPSCANPCVAIPIDVTIYWTIGAELGVIMFLRTNRDVITRIPHADILDRFSVPFRDTTENAMRLCYFARIGVQQHIPETFNMSIRAGMIRRKQDVYAINATIESYARQRARARPHMVYNIATGNAEPVDVGDSCDRFRRNPRTTWVDLRTAALVRDDSAASLYSVRPGHASASGI